MLKTLKAKQVDNTQNTKSYALIRATNVTNFKEVTDNLIHRYHLYSLGVKSHDVKFAEVTERTCFIETQQA